MNMVELFFTVFAASIVGNVITGVLSRKFFK